MLLDMLLDIFWKNSSESWNNEVRHMFDINHGAILVNECYIGFPLKIKNLLRCEFMKMKICAFSSLIW